MRQATSVNDDDGKKYLLAKVGERKLRHFYRYPNSYAQILRYCLLVYLTSYPLLSSSSLAKVYLSFRVFFSVLKVCASGSE